MGDRFQQLIFLTGSAAKCFSENPQAFGVCRFVTTFITLGMPFLFKECSFLNTFPLGIYVVHHVGPFNLLVSTFCHL